jgi:hypothetical protein
VVSKSEQRRVAIQKSEKKLGRPVERQPFPLFVFGNEQRKELLFLLQTKGGVNIPEIGEIVVRQIKQKKLFHNKGQRNIIIKAHGKLHILTDKALSLKLKSWQK